VICQDTRLLLNILNYNYSIDWEDTKIQDIETNYNKRKISEMLHIKEQTKGSNSQRNT